MRLFAGLALLLASSAATAEEFGFDLEALEPRPYEWSGYTEFRFEGLDLNREASGYTTGYPNSAARAERWSGALELSGDYRWEDLRFSATWHGSAVHENFAETLEGIFYEAYLHHSLSPRLSWELGKRARKWGKGYAWNPVGFVERPKDPSEPEQEREGFVTLGGEWVQSQVGPFQTLAFSTLLLPVDRGLNEDFGSEAALNPAARLYLLYRDIDIDLMALSDGTRPGRFGTDFSLNLASHIEIHGEWAYQPDFLKKVLDKDGRQRTKETDGHSLLLGIRYLTKNDTTWILEYLHREHGYTETEMQAFHRQAHTTDNPGAWLESGRQNGYLKSNSMRDYLYLRVTQKEPFDWLYTSLSLTWIQNLQDQSLQLVPEAAYSGLDDLELRLRGVFFSGDRYTEFGEKTTERKIELRVKYFF